MAARNGGGGGVTVDGPPSSTWISCVVVVFFFRTTVLPPIHFSTASPPKTCGVSHTRTRRVCGHLTCHPLPKLPPIGVQPLGKFISNQMPTINLLHCHAPSIAMHEDTTATKSSAAPIARPRHVREVAVIAVKSHRRPTSAKRTNSHGETKRGHQIG